MTHTKTLRVRNLFPCVSVCLPNYRHLNTGTRVADVFIRGEYSQSTENLNAYLLRGLCRLYLHNVSGLCHRSYCRLCGELMDAKNWASTSTTWKPDGVLDESSQLCRWCGDYELHEDYGQYCSAPCRAEGLLEAAIENGYAAWKETR